MDESIVFDAATNLDVELTELLCNMSGLSSNSLVTEGGCLSNSRPACG